MACVWRSWDAGGGSPSCEAFRHQDNNQFNQRRYGSSQHSCEAQIQQFKYKTIARAPGSPPKSTGYVPWKGRTGSRSAWLITAALDRTRWWPNGCLSCLLRGSWLRYTIRGGGRISEEIIRILRHEYFSLENGIFKEMIQSNDDCLLITHNKINHWTEIGFG